MHKIFKAIPTIALAALTVAAAPALAQMGGGGGMGGMGGGGQMGGGRGGGMGGHHRGGGQRGPGGAGGQGGGQQGPLLPPATIPLAMRLTGVVVVVGESKALSHGPLVTDKPDTSALFVSRGGQATLDTVQVESHGAASLLSDTRGSGINSALLVNDGSSATVTGGSIATTGQGGDGAYADGLGSRLALQGTAIGTVASGAYGLEINRGATLEAKDLTVTTGSDHAPAIGGEGGGAIALSGGNYTTGGPGSPVLMIGGDLTATGITGQAARSDGLTLTGTHTISLSDSTLSADGYAVALGGDEVAAATPGAGGMVPGEAMLAQPAGEGSRITIDGGRLSGRTAVFSVSNTRAHIVLSNVALASEDGVLVRAAAGTTGTLGRNGGVAVVDAQGETLDGNMAADVISSIRLNLTAGSHFTGTATHRVDVALDGTSDWVLTGDSGVGALTIDGVSDPGQITRIDSQGHTLSYDETRNPWLGGKTWPLKGGGSLVPGI